MPDLELGCLGKLDLFERFKGKESAFDRLGLLQSSVDHHIQFADVLFIVAYTFLY